MYLIYFIYLGIFLSWFKGIFLVIVFSQQKIWKNAKSKYQLLIGGKLTV